MGFEDKRLVLAGSSTPGRGTPWGSVIEVVQKVLRPYVTSVEIESKTWGMHNVEYVLDGRAQLGAMNIEHLVSAYRGTNHFAEKTPETELRVIAQVNQPVWLAIAVRDEIGISDLTEIIDKRLPLRIRASTNGLPRLVLKHYGLTHEALASFGGALLPVHGEDYEPSLDAGPVVEPTLAAWVKSGEFDVIIDTIYSGYTPETHHWPEAAILSELRFLPVPEAIAREATRAGIGEWSMLPHRLVRGLWHDVASVTRYPHAIYGLADVPDGFAHLLAQSLDENRALFRQSHLALSYDPLNVAMGYGVPLHPGARRYYAAMRYPMGSAESDHDHGEGEGGHHHGESDHDHVHHHGHDHEGEQDRDDDWSHLAGARRAATAPRAEGDATAEAPWRDGFGQHSH